MPSVSEQSDLLLLCKLPALVTHTWHSGLILNLTGNMRLSGLSKEESSPLHYKKPENVLPFSSSSSVGSGCASTKTHARSFMPFAFPAYSELHSMCVTSFKSIFRWFHDSAVTGVGCSQMEDQTSDPSC